MDGPKGENRAATAARWKGAALKSTESQRRGGFERIEEAEMVSDSGTRRMGERKR